MTVEIPLSHGYVALVDEEDAELVLQFKWRATVFRHKHVPDSVYADYQRQATKTKPAVRYAMHRLILGAPKGLWVDHINHNGLDNRRVNLRLAAPSQNTANMRSIPSKYGFRGVRSGKGKFFGEVYWNGGRYQTSHLASPIDAAIARDVLAQRLHGEFAVLNFPVAAMVGMRDLSDAEG